MARRRKTSPLEDFLDLTAMLPWWAGVALGFILFLVLRSVAAQPVPTSVAPGQIGTALAGSIFRAAASVFQYIVPLLCFAGAGMSAWRRRERRALVNEVSRSDAADVLDGMSWQTFENLVSEAFRLQGYRVMETGGGGPDGGVDLMLSRGSEKFLVQCKQWKAYRVGVEVVRELYGVMAAKGSAGGFVVTSGRFTDDANAFASGRNIELVNGQALHAMIRQAQQRTPHDAVAPVASAPAKQEGAPGCPICSRAMIRRTSTRGANAGSAFWGCSAFPSCRGTRRIG